MTRLFDEHGYALNEHRQPKMSYFKIKELYHKYAKEEK